MLTTNLQWRQEIHDRLFHSDIYTLDKARRLTHLVLHLVKYNGKLFEICARCYVAVDALIVLHSIANTLNWECGDIDVKPKRYSFDDPDCRAVAYTGRLCKLLEGLDHLEPSNFHADFIDNTQRLIEVWQQVFYDDVESAGNPALHEKPLSHHYTERLINVEEKNIFYPMLVKQYPELKRLPLESVKRNVG